MCANDMSMKDVQSRSVSECGIILLARKNRVSVYDGIYHVTSRIANRTMLLAEDEVKDRIMDNHLHLFVHVPPVPKLYWLNPDDDAALLRRLHRPQRGLPEACGGIPAGEVPAGGVAVGQKVPRVRLGAAASGPAEGRGVGLSRDSETKASARRAVCATKTT